MRPFSKRIKTYTEATFRAKLEGLLTQTTAGDLRISSCAIITAFKTRGFYAEPSDLPMLSQRQGFETRPLSTTPMEQSPGHAAAALIDCLYQAEQTVRRLGGLPMTQGRFDALALLTLDLDTDAWQRLLEAAHSKGATINTLPELIQEMSELCLESNERLSSRLATISRFARQQDTTKRREPCGSRPGVTSSHSVR